MLDSNQIESHRNTLQPLLEELRDGKIECIEYGKPDDQYFSYLRIRYIPTAGGQQFQIRTLSHGVEGSGYYTPDIDTALSVAMDSVLHYHRANQNLTPAALRLLQELRKQRPSADVLTFYPVANESTRTVNIRARGLEEWRVFKDAVEINFDSDKE